MMKKRLSCLSLLLSLLLWLALAGSALASQDFVLSNESGWTFRNVWLSPSGNKKWQTRDKLKMNPLKSGWHTTIINFHNGSRSNIRYWDLRVDLTNGEKHEWHRLDLLEISKIEIDEEWTAHHWD